MLFLDMMHIVDIVLAPVTIRGLAVHLKVLIRDFWRNSKHYFQKVPLFPKCTPWFITQDALKGENDLHVRYKG